MNALILWSLFVLLNVFSDSEAQPQRCKTPNNEPGSCIPMSECSFIQQILSKSVLFNNDVKYIQGAQCGNYQNDVLVCCAKSKTGPATSALSVKMGTKTLLPVAPACGVQYSDRIVGGEQTGITDFPWTARIQHYDHRHNDYAFHCGGSLINERYVLTAAHCISGIPASWSISAVRLGEWDVLTDPECKDGDNDCYDPVQDIEVEKAIVHEKFINTRLQVHNDIALLRLAREAQMSQTVVPICLPLGESFAKRRYDGLKMFVAGWGQTEFGGNSRYKLVVGVNGIAEQRCRRQYLTANINDRQICAGEVAGKDSCKGDSGGPLMDVIVAGNEVIHYLAGVVSFGKQCGKEGVPGVYTKVNRFGDWILKHLEP
ncbi:CLIP domain-containing serine protease B4-like [Topomyia yanbarensis]|uniref:CLIP domain-containing serine protease B4-like n=1 Tax=Topomyia yanbarensis TaxID=2498891 RepID=UPI00273AB949|nr:CLIP domain-containing serine protease B4-like [Topomyia yanbarensis]